MDPKTKELIAIGASVASNCIPCFKFHHKKAQELGATDAEIKEAINMGRVVRKGAGNNWDKTIDAILASQKS